MDIINSKIKELRQEKKLTQKELAIKLGVSSTCYAGWEQGYREPSLECLIKLCKILEISSDYLLGLSDI